MFDPQTSSEKKREIDKNLTQFKNRKESILIVEEILKTKQTDDVVFYCLSVYEEFVARYWYTLSLVEKERVKSFLLRYLDYTHKISKSFILNKTIKIIVDIGKRGWPNEFPELLPITENLLSEKRVTGLTMMKVSFCISNL